jgi:hypothetical protein
MAFPGSVALASPPCSWGNFFASRQFGALRPRAGDKGSFQEVKVVECGFCCSGGVDDSLLQLLPP